MVNQVYLLPKSSIGSVHPSTQPSIMQVRSVTTTIPNPPNGIPGGISILPRSSPALTTGYATLSGGGSGVTGSVKLANFLIQLLELSKNNKDTHNAVVHLVQALINAELDANNFCTQLRTNLRSANTSMDIAPFIKENIDSLRRDMVGGLCHLPNILPPLPQTTSELPFSNASTLGLPASGVGTLVVSNSSSVLPTMATPTPLVSFPSSPGLLSSGMTTRLGVPAANLVGTPPRIIGSLIAPSGAAPNLVATGVSTVAPAVVATPLATSGRLHTTHPQHPILAPAPPRVQSISPAALTAAPPSSLVHPKYRFPQPMGPIMTVSQVTLPNLLPVTAAPECTNTSTRLTSAATAAASARTGNLRPITATPISVAPAPSRPVQSIITSPLIRSKSGVASSSTSLLSAQVSVSSASTTPASVLVNGSTAGRAQLVTAPSVSAAVDKTNPDESSTLLATSSSDRVFFPTEHIRSVIASNPNTSSLVLSDDALLCLSHGLQSFVRNVLTRLSLVVRHRTERLSDDPQLIQVDNTREQLRFLQKLDEHDRLRQSELEKDLILKAAKSRSRNEDPDQVRMREMARRIATEDYEREKQHQANLTALHAIGPQRKRRFDATDDSSVVTTANITPTSESSLLSGGLPQRDIQPTNALQGRLSIATAGSSRVPLVTTCSSNPTHSTNECNILMSHSASGGQFGGGNDSTGSSTNLLSHSSRRTYVATVRDLQVVMSRNHKLRRTRTYYKTHWRS